MKKLFRWSIAVFLFCAFTLTLNLDLKPESRQGVVLAMLASGAVIIGRIWYNRRNRARTGRSQSYSTTLPDVSILDTPVYDPDDDGFDSYDPDIHGAKSKIIKLAGVTFKNDDGSSRQSYLNKLKFHNEPFDGSIDIELDRYTFNGEPAILVTANGHGIGNIPKADIDFLLENTVELVGHKVTGGGRTDDGERKSYGCLLKFGYDSADDF